MLAGAGVMLRPLIVTFRSLPPAGVEAAVLVDAVDVEDMADEVVVLVAGVDDVAAFEVRPCPPQAVISRARETVTAVLSGVRRFMLFLRCDGGWPTRWWPARQGRC
jgi:hypothetical protein